VADSLYVYSSSEPHNEEQEMDFRRLHHWLGHPDETFKEEVVFQMRSFGLPLEKNGKWEIPEDQKGLHASGHACGPDLLRTARDIKPEVLVPVHCEKPEFYLDNLSGSGIEVILPIEGLTTEI